MNNSLHLFVLSSYSFVFLQLVLLGDPFLRAQRTLNIFIYNDMAGPKGKGIASSIVVLRVIKSKVRKGGCVVKKIGVIFGKPRQTDRRLRYVVAWCILDV